METPDNLRIWKDLEDIDPKFTKQITGKPYKGTSPNPHYIVKLLTETFGPVGVGWGVRVVAEGFQPLGDEVLHWCRIEMWHTDRANTFEQYGQTKALAMTRAGLKSDEDAPKKSFTDAMTKGASYIGCAANIFLGRWDDSQYVEQVNQDYRADENKPNDNEIQATIEQINAAETVVDLGAYWTEINRHARHVAGDAKVIAAKDAKKAELEKV